MGSKILSRMRYIYRGHILNHPWKERKERRRVRNEAYGRMVMENLDKYIPFIKGLREDKRYADTSPKLGKLEKSSKISKSGLEGEPAFSMWLQGEECAPEIVKKCWASQRKYFGEGLKILDKDSVFDYIDLPETIKKKWEEGKMIPAHFSDLLRLELLYEYGGYWHDATLFFTGDVSEDIRESDFFMVTTSKELLEHTMVQNYIIRAKKGDPLLGMWKDVLTRYWENEERAADYYVTQYLFRMLVEHNEHARNLYEKMPKISINDSQLLWREIGDCPYEPELYRKMCETSFFQKCSYKHRKELLWGIKPGSMADYVINNRGSEGKDSGTGR